MKRFTRVFVGLVFVVSTAAGAMYHTGGTRSSADLTTGPLAVRVAHGVADLTTGPLAVRGTLLVADLTTGPLAKVRFI